MNSALRLLLIVAALALAAWITRRRDAPTRPVPVLFDLWGHLHRAFAGRRALFALAAVLTTVLFVLLGWDRALQDLWQRWNPLGTRLPRAVLHHGEYWTVAVAGALLLAGLVLRRGLVRFSGAVALQAVVAGLVVTLTLKLVTGRRGPANPHRLLRPPFPKAEDAGDFAFDLWNRTLSDGRFFWPSGHTLSSMVLVTALASAFPARRWIGWVGYPLVAFVAFAMIDGDFHWASDVVAAVLLGYPLGRVVGTRLATEHAIRT